MKKSLRNITLACLAFGVVLGSVNTSQAQSYYSSGYGPTMGPIRSLGYYTGAFLAYRPSFGAYRSARTAYYPGSFYQSDSCNPCNTGCNSCYSGGCASGNCSSATTPAIGTTVADPAPVPTTTFKSEGPTINPEAVKDSKTEEKINKNYDEGSSNLEGFSPPLVRNKKDDTETKPAEETDAIPFVPRPDSKEIEALKPSAPPVPTEKRPPAPSPLDTKEINDGKEVEGINLPTLQLIPVPTNIDEAQITQLFVPKRTRTSRTARFTIPQVARVVPQSHDSLIPSLPAPVQVAGK